MSRIEAFLAPAQVTQMLGFLRSVLWIRCPSYDRSVPEPQQHAGITGQLCGFFSQPPLLRQLSDQFGLVQCFGGNFEQVTAGADLPWSVVEGARLGTVIVLSGECSVGGSPLNPGDAFLSPVTNLERTALHPRANADSIWIRGYFCSAASSD